MDFGSSHVYLVSAVATVASDQDIQPSVQPEISTRSAGLDGEAEATALSSAMMPKSGAVLTYKDAILDIKNVYNLTEHVVDWFGLGTQLEITNSRLKKIRLENDTEDDCRREMIVSWLYGDPEASWKKLSKALVRVDHRVLADRIDREILPLLQHSRHFKGKGPRAAATYRGNEEKYFKAAPSPGMFNHFEGLKPRESAMESLAADDEYYDADISNPPPPKKPKRNPKGEDTDTNILMIKFGALSKPCKVHTGDPVICSNDQCAAILNYQSKITKETGGEGNVWICEFCGTKNTIEIEAGEIPKEGEILYLQQPQNSPKHDTLVSGITKDSIVIFCVDTSGSMGVTTEVPGKKELKGHEKLQKLKDIYAGSGIQYMPGQYRNVTYISRLQCVQAAIDHQLTTLARNNPTQRVAIVMFGDEVTVTGDGKPENEFVFVGEKLWKESAMLKLIQDIPTPSPIKESGRLLNEKVFSIEEEGQTALGGALLVSVELAKRAPGSKVILCTDGLANRGIGNLDDQKCIESSIAFYKKLGMAAKESSVSVSVLTIKGTDCDLFHLGEVSNLSGGTVEVVDPMSLSEEFVNILSMSVVAIRVNARIILHSKLSFKDGDGKNTLSVPVGNVMDTTKLMYEFSSLEKNASTCGSEDLCEVPFQLQIKYTSLDGQQCLRVFSEVRPTTSDKGVANKGAKDDVLMTYKLNKEGREFFHNDLDYQSGYSFKPPACATLTVTGLGAPTFPGAVIPPRNSMRTLIDSEALDPPPDIVEYCADLRAASAYQKLQGRTMVHKHSIKVQKHITLSNEGYGFGFLISPAKESGTVVESLIPNGVAWKQGELRKGDKLLAINDECVENMPHQDVVKKLRLLNEEATNSVTLCIMREEYIQDPAEQVHSKLIPISLQGHESKSFGLAFKFDDSQQLIIEEIQGDGIAKMDGRLKVNDVVLEIDGEAVSGKTTNDISVMMKEIEERSDSLELLVRREASISSSFYGHRKEAKLYRHAQHSSSWSQPSSQTPEQETNSDEIFNSVEISLCNQGQGFGFTVQEAEDKSVVVSTVFSEGVAHNDGHLRANDKLVEINGRKVSDMTYKEVIAVLRALSDDDHSTVDLKIKRNVY